MPLQAFILNKDETIPAIIKKVTDEEVMRIAMTENLERKNLSPIEEANGFLYFIENHNYTIEDLVLKFGKNLNYIRGRLRLLRLTDDFRKMLEENEITFTMAFELSKYSAEIQADVYSEHFVTDGNTNWKDLGMKDFSGRIQRLYTMDLSTFNFDKTQCTTCPFNTEVYDLFTESSQGRCTNNECLQQKRNEYTLSFCKIESEKNPSITLCVNPFDKVKEDIGAKLKDEGLEIKTVVTKDYPVAPIKPEASSFKMNFEYEKALEEYKIEDLAFYNEVEEIETKVENGEYKKFVYIGDGNPKICYAPVEKTTLSDPISELKEQDKKNKEAAMKNVYKESMEVLKTHTIPEIEFSISEDEIYLFLLLNFLEKKNFIRFGITDEKKTFLTDEDKNSIIRNITPGQRNLLQREFIIKHFPSSSDPNSRIAFLVPQLSMIYFPNETHAIANKHMGAYKKNNQLIEAKIKKIDEAKGKKKVAEIPA
ncbi:ParB/RepB/Spo0J family partition protein [Dysgonomonas sp. ZJ279]|uniref:ParB/RepB/Spo0J family partition protein n=1 Tax=Dysgonomonas sp. ZJ279 TaxID=2709796 RepID=UPI0013EA9206|nr:hypothetical protein [Dysgonomonas sp. ZJ279]